MLRDRNIALLVFDEKLRTELYLLLTKAGAGVYAAESEEQLASILERLDVEVLILAGEAQGPTPSLN